MVIIHGNSPSEVVYLHLFVFSIKNTLGLIKNIFAKIWKVWKIANFVRKMRFSPLSRCPGIFSCVLRQSTSKNTSELVKNIFWKIRQVRKIDNFDTKLRFLPLSRFLGIFSGILRQSTSKILSFEPSYTSQLVLVEFRTSTMCEKSFILSQNCVFYHFPVF